MAQEFFMFHKKEEALTQKAKEENTKQVSCAKAKEAFYAMKSTTKLSRTLPQNKYTNPSTKELEHFKSHKVSM